MAVKNAGLQAVTNTELQAERDAASFPVRELTHLLEGGAAATDTRERLEAMIEAEPVFKKNYLDYSRPRTDRYRRAMRKQRRLLQIAIENKIPPNELPVLRAAVGDDLGTDLQNLMFVPNIQATFSPEQVACWLPRALKWEVIGCYAQTELGHGSNVRGLETTATYIPESDEIEIHSPSLTATKWWPGALGRTANHAVVYARLVVEGKDLGIHNFMTQLRNMATHEPLQGITVGDIGSKIGYNNQDNGFCRFERVRIPRENMAMRFAKLERGGKYTAGGAKGREASYSSMTYVRATIVMQAGECIGKLLVGSLPSPPLTPSCTSHGPL